MPAASIYLIRHSKAPKYNFIVGMRIRLHQRKRSYTDGVGTGGRLRHNPEGKKLALHFRPRCGIN